MAHQLRQLAFSLEEYSRRLKRAQAAMAKREWDALMIHDRATICYFTGMENCYMSASYAAFLPAHGVPIVVASEFEMLNAAATSWDIKRSRFRE